MLNQPRRDKIFHRARSLRKRMTLAERILWCSLRKENLAPYRFRRQVGVGNYIVDFLCVDVKLVIEVDGPSHLFQQKYDAKRTRWLESKGYAVIRFQNDEIISGNERPIKKIWELCCKLSLKD